MAKYPPPVTTTAGQKAITRKGILAHSGSLPPGHCENSDPFANLLETIGRMVQDVHCHCDSVWNNQLSDFGTVCIGSAA